ncbi:hypothetical protein ACH4MN_33245 [Streptomyces anulatus]
MTAEAAESPHGQASAQINALTASHAVATRFDKRAYVFHGAVTVAAIRLCLRS